MTKTLQQNVANRQVEVFLSNRLEILFGHLKDQLFSSGSLFSKRLIIVPSRPMEGWVKQQLARSSVYSATEFSFLENGVETLAKVFCEDDKKASFPSFVELFLALVHALYKGPSSPLLSDYLKTQKKEKRGSLLALRLTSLFKRYSVYAHPGWQDETTGWQRDLWNEVFDDEEFDLRNLKFTKGAAPDLSVDLFSFNHIPQLYFDFFQKVATFIPVRLYHLSPTAHFWSDAQSVKENRFYLKRLQQEGVSEASQKALKAFQSDLNPLLLSLGKVGRKSALQLETREVQGTEDYIEPCGSSQLHQLQKTWLHMIDEKGVFDGSISFHSVTTEHREIEVLKENLITVLNENPEIEPRDIVVMAPDMAKYHPYISPCFGNDLGYVLSDVPLKTDNPIVVGLWKILNLVSRRFSALAILELFDHPLLQKTHNIKPEDLRFFRDRINQMGIRWGLNLAQANALVEGELTDGNATFEAGIDALLQRFATDEVDDFSSLEGLEKIVLLLDALRQDTRVFVEGGEQTASKWSEYLAHVVQKYFGKSDNNPLEPTLKMLRTADCGDNICFETLRPLLEKLITEETLSIHKNQLQGVHFCSMLPMRALPAKVIALIGMNHDAFPRKEVLGSLDLLKTVTSDYCPSRFDFDRYLFLESLLSAREKVIISFQGRDPTDLSRLPPSILVTELIDYLEAQITIHPIHNVELPRDKSSSFLVLSKNMPCPEGQYTINVNELKRAVRSPLQNYFQKTLGVYLHEKEPLKEEEEFSLSALQRFTLRQEGLKKPLQELMQKQYNLPLGRFKELAKQQLETDVSSVHHFLNSYGITPEEIISIEIKPFDIKISPKTTIRLQGKIEGVTPKGLIVDQKNDFRGAFLSLPTFLLYSAVQKNNGGSLFFSKSHKVKEPFFDDPIPLLATYLRYCLCTLHYPIPLAPEWLRSLIDGDVVGLEKKIALSFSDSFGATFDTALLYAYRLQPLPEAKSLIEHFQSVVKQTFKEMEDGWF